MVDHKEFDGQIREFKGYRGNRLLKKAGIHIDWTPEMVEELQRCSEDLIYFAENYVKILIKGKGLQPFKPYPYQKDMLVALRDNRFNIFATARQAGKSTVVAAYVLWYMLFSGTEPVVAFLANKGKTANEILKKTKVAYESLPLWLQPGVVDWNKGAIELENGARAIAEATSSDSIRGYAIDLLFIDEAAFIDNWEEFWPSTWNTITSTDTTKAVLVSTPRGLNHFHEYWDKATKGKNEFKPIKVTWKDVPGRDEAWRQTALAGLNHDQDKFDQEHNVEFLGSSNTLLSGAKLQDLVANWATDPILEKDGLKQFFVPEKDHRYVLVADVSEGKGLDYSAFQVIDITSTPFKQVCTYRSNTMTPVEYADVIYAIAKFYNSASVLVELNSIGSQVTYILHDEKEYEHMIHTEASVGVNKRISSGFSHKPFDIGIRTTKTVKAEGCSMVKMLIEQSQLEIYDRMTIYELSRFSKKGIQKGSYEAEKGATDDLVMGLVLFAWMTNQSWFKSMTDIEVLNKLKDRDEAQTAEELVPFASIIAYQATAQQKTTDLLGNNNPEGWVLDEDFNPGVRIIF